MFRSLVAAALAAVVAVTSAPAVMALPAYAIVSQDGADSNLRVRVRLDARHAQTDLKDIADAVARRLPNGKQVSEVAFYLPAMALTAQPWAEVRYVSPTATVAILGLRLDEENAYRAELSADTRQRIGAWLTSPPALAGRLVLYRQRGKLFAEWQLRNGQKSTDEVYEHRTRAGRRFDIAGGDGGYYLLDGDGNLVLGARGAVIAIADPIKPLPEPAGKIAKPAHDATPAAPNEVARAPQAPTTGVTTVPTTGATTGPTNAPAIAQAASAPAGPAAAPLAVTIATERAHKAPARKRRVTERAAKPAARPTRQADAAGDAITRALAR